MTGLGVGKNKAVAGRVEKESSKQTKKEKMLAIASGRCKRL